MTVASSRRLLAIFFGALVLSRFINASYLPPLQDEAYYFYWSRFLDAGYFDHPPLVAWLSWPGTWYPPSILLARLGTVLLSLLGLPLIYSFMKRLGLGREELMITALLLASSSLAAILQGYITTPDIPMIFCWIAALHEAAVALDDKPSRWLSAGLFTGLGILGKYTMLLIGPVFLIALLARPRKLLQVWPYLGALVCVLTLLPHILWLANHEWITLRFQFGRGLQNIYSVQMQTGTDLPLAKSPAIDGTEARLAHYFTLPDDEISQPKPKPGVWTKYSQNISAFVGGQLSLWGLLLLPLLMAGIKRQWQPAEWASPELKALAWAAALVPLGIFALLSPVQNIEANWPAMYLFGAVALIAQSWKISNRGLFFAAFGNILISLILTLHSQWPVFSKRPHKDRILKETHGYLELAKHLQSLTLPVFTDTYQNASQMAFFEPRLKVQQWPGIARSSELLRRAAMNPWQWQDIKQSGSFFLLTDNFIPPAIPGAQIQDLTEILDCFDGGLKITRAEVGSHSYVRPCRQRIHRWSLVRYAVLP